MDRHFTCKVCGKVMDIDEPLAVSTSGVVINDKKREVDDYRLEFYGRCNDCR